MLHLILECYGCEKEKLKDEIFIKEFLNNSVEILDMTKIGEPYLVKYNGKNDDERGISGFVIIAESHISIHTWPEYNYASIDVFSCKDFDKKLITDYIKKEFNVKKIKNKVFKRGDSVEYKN